MELSLAEVQQATGAQFQGTAALDMLVRGWSTDSRTISPGDLFFALSGDNFNGHNFVRDVLNRGAVAAVVSEDVKDATNLLRVSDVLLALQQLGRHARRRWAKPIVAVTGSAGKTSTKDIIAALLWLGFVWVGLSAT